MREVDVALNVRAAKREWDDVVERSTHGLRPRDLGVNRIAAEAALAVTAFPKALDVERFDFGSALGRSATSLILADRFAVMKAGEIVESGPAVPASAELIEGHMRI